MELVAKDCLLLGAAVAKRRARRFPFHAGLGHIVELDHRNGQTVDDAPRILGQVEDPQNRLAYLIDRMRQIMAAAIEPRAFGLMREEIAMLPPAAEQGCLLVPPAALADNRHRDQFSIRAGRRRAGTGNKWRKRDEQIADEDIHPGAEVVEIGYHRSHLGWREGA